MGCSSSKTTPSEERAAIIAESGLLFQSKDASWVDSTIRKFATEQKLSHCQLEKAAKVLEVKVSNYDKHTKILEMLQKLKEAEDYHTKDILVLGILLGKGSPSLKAELIYQAFNSENSIHIGKLKSEVLQTLCKVSVNLCSLVSSNQSVISNEMKNLKYIENLKGVMTMGINRLAEKMTHSGLMITQKNFVETMSSYKGGALTSSSGLRSFLYEIYTSNPRRKAWSNPYKLKS